MNPDKTSPGQVPHSSGRNRYATRRTLTVLGAIVAFLLFTVLAVGIATSVGY
ncbi:hypothetical protein [Xylophilus sp.]|uniref:hypothetical protein n=1 Tax=Xylophilus sp. TaxID=2653893 RepID=UPI0013BC39A0|nr:hypothetical protein [Xylophilus sp.]KAF1047803.1 MAG: hypothetical protein GAK38_01746 [Xylophilus sp.]